MSANGGIVLFSSTELPELIGLCDRILVIYQGRLVGEVAGQQVDSRDAAAPHQHRRAMPPPSLEEPPHDGHARSAATRRRRFALPDEIGVIAALVAMMVIVGVARPRFLNPINLFALLGNTTFLGMLALGMVFLLAIREIDLSVGWMFNFSAVIAAMLMVAGFNPWIAALRRHRASAPGSASSTASWSSACGCPPSSSRSAPIRCSRACRWSPTRAAPSCRSDTSSNYLQHRLDQAVRRAAGRRAGVRGAGRRHACRAAPHPLRLSRAGGRQQSGSGDASPASRPAACGCRRW